jgi:uracil-DNA glycosylase
MHSDWKEVLGDYFKTPNYLSLTNNIRKEYQQKTIFPKQEDLFNCLKLCSYNSLKVVILGQDPYHGEGEAHGLSFSVKEGIKMPPSLRNIFKEIEKDLGYSRTKTDLTDWAEQGVLLLNTIMSVEINKPLSHKGMGWEEFTDYIIQKINDKKEPVVFILWGSNARSKAKFITNKQHLIIESVHPSPLSANNGFFGSKPFSKTNQFLIKNNIKPIKW